MALDATRLENRFISLFRSISKQLYPNVVKKVDVREVTKDDGTVDHEITEERGPLEIEDQYLVPLARAMAQAVVEEITAGAEVDDTDAVSGGTWRVS